MGLDVELCKVLSKSEVAKKSCDELRFIDINQLISCDINIATFSVFKSCLVENESYYYNIPVMLLANRVKTKDPNLSNYDITGFLPSERGSDYTQYEISHNRDKDIIRIDIYDKEIKNYLYKVKELGLFVQDVEYIQRKGIRVNKSLTGKCYTQTFSLFISNQSQLEKLNKNNEREDSVLKSKGFKIPKSHLLYINW